MASLAYSVIHLAAKKRKKPRKVPSPKSKRRDREALVDHWMKEHKDKTRSAIMTTGMDRAMLRRAMLFAARRLEKDIEDVNRYSGVDMMDMGGKVLDEIIRTV